jgi:hypothetical protein
MNTLNSSSPLHQARSYLERVPGAVQGQSGDAQTYIIASTLVNDFALSENDAGTLLLEWNQKCIPPWNESALRIKLHSALRCRHPNPRGCKLGSTSNSYALPASPTPPKDREKPNRDAFSSGGSEQIRCLADSRPYGIEGLFWATERGLLVFGSWNGHEVYGVTDSSGRIVEIRRIDGQPFPATNTLDERKSHAIRNSQKTWPVGILEAKNFPSIALVEGIPDFLEAHYLARWEQADPRTYRDVRCAPVSMLSASPRIAEDALHLFRGKLVRIFPHADPSGQKAGKQWADQLHGIAAKVELFSFVGLRQSNGASVNDLYDCRDLDLAEYLEDDNLWKLLP